MSGYEVAAIIVAIGVACALFIGALGWAAQRVGRSDDG